MPPETKGVPKASVDASESTSESLSGLALTTMPMSSKPSSNSLESANLTKTVEEMGCTGATTVPRVPGLIVVQLLLKSRATLTPGCSLEMNFCSISTSRHSDKVRNTVRYVFCHRIAYST